MNNKQVQIEEFILQVKTIAYNALEKENYVKSMAAISLLGNFLYQYNQYYKDDELEEYLCRISDAYKKNYAKFEKTDTSKTIMVYDGFGFDTRGVVLMYLNALGLKGYQVVYVTKASAKGKIPTIVSMCNKYNFKIEYVEMANYVKCVHELANVFERYKPRSAFFYTMPADVAGIVVFHMYENIVDRFLIDLTDHAFWLGKSAVDYFLGSREMSAYLECFERDIPKEKLIKLGVNLLVDECDNHSGLPFDPTTTRYVFSGGALYKTLGDPEKKYYKIVNHILENHQDIRFVYAGSGDTSEIDKIVSRFPQRAFHIDERKDFYYLIQNSVFYLNTYPMFGGMMMKYSGLARKLPITLRHNSDSDGLLLHQAERRIEYDSVSELLEDVDKLLTDEIYLREREKLLEGSVITEERFANNVQGVIEKHKTDYEHNFDYIDTTEFRKEYFERFDLKTEKRRNANKINISLFWEFPLLFIENFVEKIMNKVKKGAK